MEMLKEERQKSILEQLKRKNHVSVSDLTTLFHVSDETIRRDLKKLEKSGLVRCIRGGAVFKPQRAREISSDVRIGNHAVEKTEICRYAASLVNDGDSIVVTESTTTLPLARFLKEKNNITVITNSLILASEISENSSNTVILAGGQLDPSAKRTMGNHTLHDFEEINADKVFFSAAGISPDGITEYSEVERDILRAVIAHCAKSYLLNDHSKFNSIALRNICPLNRLSGVITDWKTPHKTLSAYLDAGLEIFIADDPALREAPESEVKNPSQTH